MGGYMLTSRKYIIIISTLFLSTLLISADYAYAQVNTEQINKQVLAGAREEITNRTKYNTDMLSKYFGTKYKNGKFQNKNIYPGGDVNPNEGVCTDLVVRACRKAGYDLQKMLHEDIIKDKKYYGVNEPDKYIDHRRVWLLLRYFKKHYKSLTKNVTDSLAGWQAGDIVMFDIGSKNHLHIGIVSDKVDADSKRPFVIHNMVRWPGIFSGRTCESDILDGVRVSGKVVYNWKILGHYRLTEAKD